MSGFFRARHMLKLIGAAIVYLVVNVGISILYIAFYAYIINPGHPPAFYQAYAVTVAPYSSIVAGMPLMFFMCWWLTRPWTPGFARKSVLGIWTVYAVIDLSVLFGAGMTARLALLSGISLATKLIAAVGGATVGAAADRNAARP